MLPCFPELDEIREEDVGDKSVKTSQGVAKKAAQFSHTKHGGEIPHFRHVK